MKITPELIYTATILIFLPVLVIQTRMLLYKRMPKRSRDPRKSVLKILLNETPHDLAIIGMTLGFLSFALTSKSSLYFYSHVEVTLLLIIAPLVPFALMSAIPLFQSKEIRMALGLYAYLTGAAAFIFAQFVY